MTSKKAWEREPEENSERERQNTQEYLNQMQGAVQRRVVGVRRAAKQEKRDVGSAGGAAGTVVASAAIRPQERDVGSAGSIVAGRETAQQESPSVQAIVDAAKEAVREQRAEDSTVESQHLLTADELAQLAREMELSASDQRPLWSWLSEVAVLALQYTLLLVSGYVAVNLLVGTLRPQQLLQGSGPLYVLLATAGVFLVLTCSATLFGLPRYYRLRSRDEERRAHQAAAAGEPRAA